MADLLEALLQIKALAGTPARAERLLESTDPALWRVRGPHGGRSPAEALAHLADAEAVFLASVRLVLERERPTLSPIAPSQERRDAPGRDPTVELARFASRRRETVALLSSCSAAQLERAGVHPVRKLVTVADVVAIMLAHDTDALGEIAARLGAVRPPEGPAGGR